MYQRVGQIAYKADLGNTLKLAAELQQPQRFFKSVHVAGTNGKGSTSHMLASVLQEAGYKVGLYTSPHLKDFRERIKINGQMIPKRMVTKFIKDHKAFFEAHHLSFFEMTVGLAFSYFRIEKVDIAIIETGMGGRLDSTNIIHPEVSVITNIGMDHTQFLGSSLAEIASEKAGIIKPGVPVIIGETLAETKGVFEKVASEKKAPIVFAEEQEAKEIASDLLGAYQKKNKQTVLATLDTLKEKGWKVPASAITAGFKKVTGNTGLMGRWQILQHEPKVICDTAHNKEGFQWVLTQLMKEKFNKLHMVLGFVKDKDLLSVLPLFPESAEYYFCKPAVPRGLASEALQKEAATFGLHGKDFGSVKKAYTNALNAAGPQDVIYIGGSTFVVAEVL